MNITKETALLWAKRMFKALNGPDGEVLRGSLSGAQKLLARGAGCAHWHEFEKHLHRPNFEQQKKLSLASYDPIEVQAAILNAFSCFSTHPSHRGMWIDRAMSLLHFAFTMTPKPFNSIADMREAITVESLVQFKGNVVADKYLTAIMPDMDWTKIMQSAEMRQAEVDRWKVAHADSYFPLVQEIINNVLDSWDVLLNESDYGAEKKTPVTFDILIRCTEQGVAWPQEWRDWFIAGQASSNNFVGQNLKSGVVS